MEHWVGYAQDRPRKRGAPPPFRTPRTRLLCRQRLGEEGAAAAEHHRQRAVQLGGVGQRRAGVGGLGQNLRGVWVQ